MSKVSKFLLSAVAVATVAGGFTATSAPHAEAATTTIRVGTGKADYKDSSGNVWSKDTGFVGGYQVSNVTKADIKGTDSDALYQNEHWGMSAWRANVPNGKYEVTLKFAETYYGKANTRVMTVTAEGATVLKNLDVFAEAGKNTRLDKTFTVQVKDGRIDLGFQHVVNNGNIQGIQVQSVSGSTGGVVVTPTPRPTTPTPTVPAPTTPAPTTPAPTTPAPTTPAPTTPAPTTPAPANPDDSTPGWLSGSSGVGVGNGQFGSWRGSAVEIAASWANDNTNNQHFWQLDKGAEYGSWNTDMDMAVGGIDRGETWAQGASGQFDARWRASLKKLKSQWGDRQGTMYIRLAHEMNGYWFPWSVNTSNYKDFVTSWKRYRALQKEVFPEAKLVFSVNRDSNGTGMDWTKFFPGKEYVDVLTVDYYNQYPYAATKAQFDAASWDKDGYGAPKGIRAHAAFAKSQGIPFGVSEWSGNADNGDGAGYVEGMYAFFKENAGTGPGQVLYDIQFNCDIDGKRWLIYGSGVRMPSTAAKYRDLF
ncbi:malectin domain-containing carbohydrate-binding protein [Kineococcus sp. SYSU DK003]|uniref:malectin domain-containing carbohydrate-binding protein n=1 Tax=Kineococcus sp. SYSU DK003 TaxID=3383124 RepID=UPI003D7E407E